MAKPTFSKLKLQLDKNTVSVQIGEQTITVRQYLPIQEKLELISRVIVQAHEPESNYNNPIKTDALIVLEVIFAYTDLVFTDKQKEDLPKLYDLLHCNGIDSIILNTIGANEYDEVKYGVYRSIDAIYAYQNSVLGILDNVSQNYDDLNLSLDTIQDKIKNGEGIEFVKDLVTKIN